MTNVGAKKLCLELIKSDREEDVISLLKNAGYWSRDSAWRFYDDNESNYSTIGNQQSRPEAALVEKLVNSEDARLMSKCLVRKIDPEGPSAPKSPREAVAQFFEENPDFVTAGLIVEWPVDKRTKVAKGITLAVTGAKPGEGCPSYTISDCGEGQTPRIVPRTFLSLNKDNKLRIPFVQGKFNMGGTGALQFCGHHNLQLIVTRRHPTLLKEPLEDPSDIQWSFTVVRREDPSEGRRNSVYTYLAPIYSEDNPRKGDVLCFSAETLPIFPEGNTAYAKNSKWGTLIKLYEYNLKKTHILRKGGLLAPLDLLIPRPALPIRFHECRGYGGHAGSFDTSLTGLHVRLGDDKGENVEFQYTCSMSVLGEEMSASIFAFKKGKAETYRRNEGVIFTVQGQTHGRFTTDFFRRKTVGLSYLADSILIIVDCTNFSGRSREDLFMNSRDRLRHGELLDAIERTLEEELKSSPLLRELKDRRRNEAIAARVADSRPLEQVLESVLKKSPSLSRLFLEGKRLTKPFKPKHVEEEEKDWEGERYPTYFKFRKKDYGELLERECHINMRCRISFETDAENTYFNRDVNPGKVATYLLDGDSRTPVKDYTLNLQNGVATLNLRLPEGRKEGDKLRFLCRVIDPIRIEPFDNFLNITVKEPVKPTGEKGKRRKPPSKKRGDDRETAGGIQLPKVIEVKEEDWAAQKPPFDQYTAMVVKHAGTTSEDDDSEIYDFFLNVDNIYLKSEQKTSTEDTEILRARFETGLVLIGLGLLHDDAQKGQRSGEVLDGEQSESGDENIEKRIERVTSAVAPLLLPMIDSLGSLSPDEAVTVEYSAEAI